MIGVKRNFLNILWFVVTVDHDQLRVERCRLKTVALRGFRHEKKVKASKWKKLAIRDGIGLCAKDSVDFNWIFLLA